MSESNQAESRTATIAGRGQAQTWDLARGEIHPISGAMTTTLKSWEDLGTPSFAGPATYRKQFTAPAGERVFLEIGDVRDYALVKLNGKELGARAWQPYRWEITSSLKGGANDLEIQVNATPAGGRGGRGGAPAVSGLLGPVRLVTR